MLAHTSDFTADEIKTMTGICDIMDTLLTKPYELHMANLLIELKNHFDMVPEDFTYLDKNVLLLLSEDDYTFHEEVKSALATSMPKAKLITDLTGGHLSLMVNPSKYVQTIVDFIK